jgi:hypothetical protein
LVVDDLVGNRTMAITDRDKNEYNANLEDGEASGCAASTSMMECRPYFGVEVVSVHR